MGPSTFTAKHPFDPSHPDALALYCSDGRFTDAVEELLHSLGHPRLDTVTMPGGPGLLEVTTGGLSSLEATRRAVSLLVCAHGTRHMVLLAHEGCGYYKERYRMETPQEIVTQQIGDLRLAARWLRGLGEGLEVRMYYARVRGQAIHFDAVDDVQDAWPPRAAGDAKAVTPRTAQGAARAKAPGGPRKQR